MGRKEEGKERSLNLSRVEFHILSFSSVLKRICRVEIPLLKSYFQAVTGGERKQAGKAGGATSAHPSQHRPQLPTQ